MPTDRPHGPDLDGVTHRFVDVDGLTMHVAEAGRGEPVLLLHGFPQHWWEWRHIIPGLEAQHRLIMPDLRGAGWTEAPRDGYGRERLLQDVVGLLDALEVDVVHLLTHDWGAILGFQLCLQQPRRVRSHVSLSTPHPFIHFQAGLLAVMWRLWFQEAIAMPGLGPSLLSRGSQPLARYLMMRHVAKPQSWSSSDLGAFLDPLRDPARARAGSATYRRLILPEALRMLRGAYREQRLATPTVVLYGAEDSTVRPAFFDGWEGHAARLSVEPVPGAAHFLADENPAFVTRRALEHFSHA